MLYDVTLYDMMGQRYAQELRVPGGIWRCSVGRRMGRLWDAVYNTCSTEMGFGDKLFICGSGELKYREHLDSASQARVQR